MPTIEDLTGQYPVLGCLAEWLSTLDLFHLSLTSKHHFDHILASKPVFDHLKRTALCDGHGLRHRQNFDNVRYSYVWGNNRKIWQDEPVEVQLWATQCDEAGALPCRRCGINICEECRDYTRERQDPLSRRPHLNGSNEIDFIFCLCDSCDDKLESELKGQFLNELCDCEAPSRWLCRTCTKAQNREFQAVIENNTVSETSNYGRWEELSEVTKCMIDHAFEVADPCYPPFVGDRYGDNRGRPYPKLAYDGPIWKAPTKSNNEGQD